MDSPDPIARLNAALEGRYHVEREVGEGGMATVYLADDLRHQRKVALKVLKPELAAVVGADRFLAEIKTTANLQHPHILPLYDSGEADSLLFYVMPYVEGESLRERLEREHQLPVDDAVRIATNIAEALDYAHRHGVIHRDIKPANVLLQDGKPVVSDFGIALAVGAAGGGRLTETGLYLGTPHYMSPEQATGDETLGPAADVYALGCVLYECLVGDPPFTGASTVAVLGKLLSGEPASTTAVRRSVPVHVDEAVLTALERTPADRFRTAADFSRALGDSAYRRRRVDVAPDRSSGGRWRGMAVAAVVAAALGALLGAWAIPRAPSDAVHFRIPVRFAADQALSGTGHFDLSADGSTLVYQGVGESDRTRLWVRRSDAVAGVPIPGTEGLSPSIVPDIAISPDGEQVVFFRGGSFHVVPTSGGTPREVADSVWGTSRWSPDGQWIYLRRLSSPGLSRVPAGGGAPEVVTVPDTARGETGHVWPEVLPGGDVVLYEARAPSGPMVRAMRLGSGDVIDVVRGRYPRYANDHLLFMSEDGSSIMAAPFDVRSLRLRGDPSPIVTGLPATGRSLIGAYGYAVSRTGVLVYAPERAWTMLWADGRGGTRAVDPDWDLPSRPGPWRLSPDGSRVAVRFGPAGAGDVWLKELPRGPEVRLTSTPGEERPVGWVGNDTVLILADGPSGLDLWSIRADGVGGRTLVHDHATGLAAATVGRGGEHVVFTTVIERFAATGPVGSDLYSLERGGGAPRALLTSDGFSLGGVRLDARGSALAYHTTRSGAMEVVVRPFPNFDDGQVQVSVTSGTDPVWSADGATVYYVSGSREVIAGEIVERSPLRVVRTPLFELDHRMMSMLEVAPSGDFMVATSEPELVIVFDWLAILE